MENEPLLRRESSCSSSIQSENDSPVDTLALRSFFICIFCLEFCVQFVQTLLELPMIRLVEMMVCQQTIADGIQDIDEEACKVPTVQNKVAFIIGYKTTLDALPCLLTALFYGRLSDSWGRKSVIRLQTTGRFLSHVWIVLIYLLSKSVPPELIWLSSLFLFIGGGRKAQVSTIYASFCDIVPENKRTQLLTLAHASEGLSGIISYPLGSFLMARSLWIPFALALTIIVSEYVVLWFTRESSPFVANEDAQPATENATSDCQTSNTTNGREAVSLWIRHSSVCIFFKHLGLSIVLLSFFVKRIAFAAEDFISQYVSETLHRRIYETFWLQIFNHFGMLLTLSVLIPFATRHMESPTKDLRIVYSSLVSIMAGFIALWRGKQIPILCFGLLACGLGEGLDVALQSLGSHIVGKSHHGTFFPLTSTLGVAGELLGGPIMAATYAIRDENGSPLGSCFLVSTSLFLCIFLSSFFINTKRLPG